MNNSNQCREFKSPPNAGSRDGDAFSVSVKSYPIPECDVDAWEAATVGHMEEILPEPPLGCYYVNPRFLVHASDISEAFLKTAHKARASWCRYISAVLGPSNMHREMKKAPYMKRQLAFAGILFVNGVHIAPQDWSIPRVTAVVSKALAREERRQQRMINVTA